MIGNISYHGDIERRVKKQVEKDIAELRAKMVANYEEKLSNVFPDVMAIVIAELMDGGWPEDDAVDFTRNCISKWEEVADPRQYLMEKYGLTVGKEDECWTS